MLIDDSWMSGTGRKWRMHPNTVNRYSIACTYCINRLVWLVREPHITHQVELFHTHRNTYFVANKCDCTSIRLRLHCGYYFNIPLINPHTQWRRYSAESGLLRMFVVAHIESIHIPYFFASLIISDLFIFHINMICYVRKMFSFGNFYIFKKKKYRMANTDCPIIAFWCWTGKCLFIVAIIVVVVVVVVCVCFERLLEYVYSLLCRSTINVVDAAGPVHSLLYVAHSTTVQENDKIAALSCGALTHKLWIGKFPLPVVFRLHHIYVYANVMIPRAPSVFRSGCNLGYFILCFVVADGGGFIENSSDLSMLWLCTFVQNATK